MPRARYGRDVYGWLRTATAVCAAASCGGAGREARVWDTALRPALAAAARATRDYERRATARARRIGYEAAASRGRSWGGSKDVVPRPSASGVPGVILAFGIGR